MNQEKIGKFIAECRKNKKMTQEQLAEKLKVSNKSVSRWENGKTMPDYSVLKDLCNILDIDVNELLSGEKINKEEEMLHSSSNHDLILRKYYKITKLKNVLKKIAIVIGIIVGVILLDTMQAIIFNNSPIIILKTSVYSECHKEHEGIFVTTTIYDNEEKRTKFNWEVSNLIIKTCEDPYKIVINELNDVNDIIVEKLVYQDIQYDNYSYNYVDTKKRVVVVGLEDNSEEEQKWFRNNIVDSEYLYFEQGGKATTTPKQTTTIVKPKTTTSAPSTKTSSAERKSFLGKVYESYSTYIMIEPNDNEQERKSADKFKINLPINSDSVYEVGSIVRITYDGRIMESYPAKVNAIKVEVVEE